MNTSLDASGSETEMFDLHLINQSLHGLVNKVITASGETDLSALKVLLLDLRETAIAQFACEELAMNVIKYGAAAQHHSEHAQFLTEIRRQIDDLEAGKGDRSILAQFIQSWFLRHVVSQDLLFTASFVLANKTASLPLTHGDKLGSGGGFDERRFDIPEPIVWSPKHSVDIQPIDEDHKAIFFLLKDIVESRASSDRTNLAMLLERLGDKTSAHFKSEEKVMHEYNYEFAAAHCEQHQKLLDEYAHQVDEYRNNSISAELMCRFIYQWFVRHIEMSDIPLSNAIRGQIFPQLS